MGRGQRDPEQEARDEAAKLKAHQQNQAINDYIRARRTPSAVSGSIVGPLNVDEKALNAIRNVTKLRQGRRAEPRGASEPKQTCYRNSTLFTLLCTDAFMGFIRNYWITHRQEAIVSDAVEDDGHPKPDDDHPFGLLSELWEAYWNPNRDEDELDSAMKDIWERLLNLPGVRKQWQVTEGGRGGRKGGRGIQQDAEEFLTWFLGAEAESLKKLDGLFDQYRKVCSITTTNSVMCVSCFHDKDKQPKRFRRVEEATNMLQLALPPDHGQAHTLKEVFQRYFKYQASGWLCDTCSDEFDSSVDPAAIRDKIRDTYFGPAWRHIASLPEVMFMQLMRFEQHQDTGVMKKNNLAIDIPGTINLKQYIELDADTDGDQHANAEYEITGVISHSGSLTAGHYKTQVRIDGPWFEIDTESCERTTFEKVVKPKASGWTPYILVWQRRTGNEPDLTEANKRLEAARAAHAAREARKAASNGNARHTNAAKGPTPPSKRKANAVQDEVEDIATPSKRTKAIPNLFPRVGDDPRGYPSTATRRKIQHAIDRAVDRYESKWKDWQPSRRRSQVLFPPRVRSGRAPSPEPRSGPVTPSNHRNTSVGPRASRQSGVSNPKPTTPPPTRSLEERRNELLKHFDKGGANAGPLSRRRSTLQRSRVAESGGMNVGIGRPRSLRSNNDGQHPAPESLAEAKRYWAPGVPKSPTSRKASGAGSSAQATSSSSVYGDHGELAMIVDARTGATPSAQEMQLAQAAPVALEPEPPRSLLSCAKRLARRRARRFRERPSYFRLAVVLLAIGTFPWMRHMMPSVADLRRFLRINPEYRESFEQWVVAMGAGWGNRHDEALGRRSGR